MKAEKKLVLLGITLLFGSATLVVYFFSGVMDEHKDDSFPGNVKLERSHRVIAHQGSNIDTSLNHTGTIKTQKLSIEGASIHIALAGTPSHTPVLLLHGAAFSSKTWGDLGTLKVLQKSNFHAIAVDLPGFGKSEKLKTAVSPDLFLKKLIGALKIERPVIISPSMSGRYSVPFILNYGDAVSGYIPIAPVINEKYDKEFVKVNVPTLILYGEKDVRAKAANLMLSKIPHSEVKMIPGGSHPAYLDNPKLFHKLIVDFINGLK